MRWLLALLLLLAPGQAWAAVGYVSDTQALQNSGVDNFTFAHDCGAGSNRALIVSVDIQNQSTVVSITYGGVGLTQIGGTNFGALSRLELWGLVAPATGANDVIVTISAGDQWDASATCFDGVDQTGGATTFTGYATQAGAGASATTTVSVTSGSTSDMVLSVTVSTTDDHSSVGAGQTKQWEDNSGSTNTAGSTKTGAAGAVTMDHTWTGNGVANSHNVAGVNLTAAGGGSTTKAGPLVNAPILKGLVGGGLIQ